MLPFGMVASCSVENLTVTTTVLALWLFYRAMERRRYEVWMGRGALGAAIGTVLCLIAPGNFVRIEEDNDRSWFFHILNQFSADLEMILYGMPILLTAILALRVLRLESARRRGILPQALREENRHRIMKGVLAVSAVSFFTNGFLYRTLEWLVVHCIFFPLGLTEEVLLDHFNNTMQGVEEAVIYLLGLGLVYVTAVHDLGVSDRRMALLKNKIPFRTLVSDFPELRYAAFFVFLCLFNNLLMLGAPSFPGRALFSSSVMLVMGVVVVLRIPVVRGRMCSLAEGASFRWGGALVLGFVAVATLAVLHDIWREDAARIAYIRQQAEAGEMTVYLPPSEIPEQRRILRHIAYDDFHAGLTREPVCAYFGIHDIRLVPDMGVKMGD